MTIISLSILTLLFYITTPVYSQTLPSGHSPKIGYAFDGFPIYGLYTDGGVKPTDLDVCKGRNHSTLGYLYHLTEVLPYTIGCYSGETFCPSGMPSMPIPGCVNSIPQSGSTNELTCSDLGLLTGYSPREVPFTVNVNNIPSNVRCTVESCPTNSPYCFDTSLSVPTQLTSSVTCSVDGDKLVISSNGIPNHIVGKFPLSTATSLNNYNLAGRQDSPNSILAQNFVWRIPRYPTLKSSTPTQNILMDSNILTLGPIAFAINGVPFFNIYNSMVEDAVSPSSGGFEVLDMCLGHAQMQGAYHYHAVPYCLINAINNVNNTVQCTATTCTPPSSAQKLLMFPVLSVLSMFLILVLV